MATSLNEIDLCIRGGYGSDEAQIPVNTAVQGACELLGLIHWYIANEGKLLLICRRRCRAPARRHACAPLGQQACRIGAVTQDPIVSCKCTRFGGWRMLDWLNGEPCPESAETGAASWPSHMQHQVT